jgi:hypothetical protein
MSANTKRQYGFIPDGGKKFECGIWAMASTKTYPYECPYKGFLCAIRSPIRPYMAPVQLAKLVENKLLPKQQIPYD